jgi:hypothetical protein
VVGDYWRQSGTAASGLRAVPADDEAILGLEKIRSFIKHDQVMRIALETLFVRLLFATGYINLPLT